MSTHETNYDSDTFNDSFQHFGLCPGDKTIKQTLTIDDGTGKLFTYELTKDLHWKEYTITPDFSTDPEEPTIIDEANIIPNIGDPYDVVEDDGVDYDLSEDGIELNLQKDEIITKVLSTPRTQKITQNVRYFTGWEIKVQSIEKDIAKTNIPPKACNTLESNCFTVPVEVYTSCSTDQEDEAQNLTISWELYLDTNSTIEISQNDQGDEVRTVIYNENNANWELQASKDGNPVFSWTYNNEGQYKLVEIATDTNNDSTEAVRIFPIIFKKCKEELEQSKQTVQANGEIEVEKNVWQLCAIPMTTGYWNKNSHKIVKNKDVKSTVKNVIIDQIEDIYGVPAKDMIKVINGYTGDENLFRNYIPGFTKDSSVHNFQLVYTDNDDDLGDGNTKFEVSGFWIKAKDKNFKIKWGIIE